MTEKINSLNLVNFVLRVKSKYIETEINRLLQELESLKAENLDLVEKYEKSEDRLMLKITKDLESLHNEIDRLDDSEYAIQNQEICMKIDELRKKINEHNDQNKLRFFRIYGICFLGGIIIGIIISNIKLTIFNS